LLFFGGVATALLTCAVLQLSILGTPFDEAGPFKAEATNTKNHLCARFNLQHDLDIYMPDLASLWCVRSCVQSVWGV